MKAQSGRNSLLHSLLAFILLVFLSSSGTYAQQIDIKKDYNLKLVHGKGAANPDLTANISVIIFYSPQCPICLSMTKAVNELMAAYGDRANFILVYPGSYYSSATIRKFHKKYKVPVTAYKDESKSLTDALQATITPQAFVVNKQGRIMYKGKINNQYEDIGKRRNVVTEHYLRNALESVLKGEEPATQFTEAVGCFIEK